MTKRLPICLALAMVLLPALLWAQSSDFNTRAGLQIKQDLPKGFELGLSYQIRFRDNSQEFSGSYLSADLSYKLTKHWHALAEFRYATSYDWDKFRFGAGIVGDMKFHKFQLSAKLRYQYETFYQSIPEIGQFPARNNIRLKLQAEHKLVKHVKGHLSTEPQVRIIAMEPNFQRIRNIVGIDWEFMKHHSLDISYFYQPQFRGGNLRTTRHMLVGTYALELGKWWKPKKKSKEDGTSGEVVEPNHR